MLIDTPGLDGSAAVIYTARSDPGGWSAASGQVPSSPVSIQTQSLALATMIGCLPTQAIAFEWKPGFTQSQI